MQYILLGVGGFLVAFLFDPISLRKIPYAKPVVWSLAISLIGAAHILVCIRDDGMPVPRWLSYLGWPLLLLMTFLLIYSLYVEIPLKQTYMNKGVSNKLVTSGTYALVRHPGVLWYALFLIALILISESWLALYAAPIWLFMDILYVWIQERFFFNEMFPDYEQYKQETPMLIPNRRSIAKCLTTLV